MMNEASRRVKNAAEEAKRIRRKLENEEWTVEEAVRKLKRLTTDLESALREVEDVERKLRYARS